MNESEERIKALARAIYGEFTGDDVQIENDPPEQTSDGYWVKARLWVPMPYVLAAGGKKP